MKSFKSSRWHTTTWSHSAVAAGARPARCLFLGSRLFVSVSSSSLTPEQKDTHSWHEALSLLTPSYCELLVVLSQTLTERSGRKRLTSGSILSRGTRGEALREVLVSSPRLSLTDRRRRSRDTQRLQIYVYILANYMKPLIEKKKKKKKKNEQHVLDSSSCVTSVPTLSRLYWTWRYFTTLVS